MLTQQVERLNADRVDRELKVPIQDVVVPSTLGTSALVQFGHVRQLDRDLAETLKRAWMTGAGPGEHHGCEHAYEVEAGRATAVAR